MVGGGSFDPNRGAQIGIRMRDGGVRETEREREGEGEGERGSYFTLNTKDQQVITVVSHAFALGLKQQCNISL